MILPVEGMGYIAVPSPMIFLAAEAASPRALTDWMQVFGSHTWWELLIAYFVFNLPSLLAWWREHYAMLKIEKLYEARIEDKDKEIARQSKRIKELEAAVNKLGAKPEP